MPGSFRLFRWLFCAAALVLPACGGGDYGTVDTTAPPPSGGSVAARGYAMTHLVSDTGSAGIAHADNHLVNPWGVAFNPQAYVWVANTGSASSTLYDGNGVPQSLVVSIPPGSAGAGLPTGIVFNGQPSFRVTGNGVTGASAFIFAGLAGTVSAWSPTVDRTHAITVVDNAAAGTVYTGLAIGGGQLYAADFHNAAIHVFDTNFTRVAAATAFRDPALPAGYAPYGIQAIGDRVYVAFGRQNAQARGALAGAGFGAVDVFDLSGVLQQRLLPPGGTLNAPWGMALAPADFGPFSGALLVANVGDGKVNAFNAATGAWMGALSTASGAPIAIDGLHGIAFGNGLNAQPLNTLFFAAGTDGGTHGVYGRIDTAP